MKVMSNNIARICSKHFNIDDYERDLQNELLNLPTKKRLKKTAVPSVNLQLQHGTTTSLTRGQKRSADDERSERAAKRSRKMIVAEVIHSSNAEVAEATLVTHKDTAIQTDGLDG
jgi:hypothetical protein